MKGPFCLSVTRSAHVLGTVLGLAPGIVHAAPSPEEMWKIIQQQQKTIEELKPKLESTQESVRVTEDKVKTTEQKVEATADAIETKPAGASWADRTRVGGYGELHYNNLDNDFTGMEKDEVDFHRFVLYFGHDFTDRFRFFSELELEHSLSGEGQNGEVELEQAWVEFDVFESHRVRAGLDLIPVGIINPTHEPPTFFGVERNPVETNIIPTTWWEAGLGAIGELAPGWNYDLVLILGSKQTRPDLMRFSSVRAATKSPRPARMTEQ